MNTWLAVGLILLTFILWLPALTIDFTNKGNVFDWSRSQAGFVKVISIAKQEKSSAEALTKADTSQLPQDLVDFIKDNSETEDVVSATNGSLAMKITYFTNRKTNSGMFGEVLSKEGYEGQLSPWENNLIVCDKGECPTESRCDRAEYELIEFGDYEVLLKKEEYR